MLTRVSIIGIGSPFGDDRLGWVVAEALQRSSGVKAMGPGRVHISILDRPGAMLLAHWQDVNAVILIDAVHSNAPPGTQHCLTVADLTSGKFLTSSHGLGIADALELGGVLGNLPGSVLLFGIEIDPDCAGPSLSPAVQSALPECIRRIERAWRHLVMDSEPRVAGRPLPRNGVVLSDR